MGIGLRLKRILRDKKMTIKQLSEITNISLNTLYSITKRDSKNVDEVILQKIADALSVHITDLMGYSEIRAYIKGFDDANSDHDKFLDAMLDIGYTASDREFAIIEAFSKLNEEGKKTAVERVEELLQIPKYQRPGNYYFMMNLEN